jgi:4-amino-4-deoxy-L-arabinose transferase-like glycosyltransferase
LSNRAIEYWRRSPGACVALAVALVTLLRIAVVVMSPFQLGPDEAQYWRWSGTLDWGYYSKPPLIAWCIWLTTSLFGDAEWAVRLSSPILHGVAALALFALGRAQFGKSEAGPKAGAWAAAIYLTMPGVFLSSVIMSTDAVLLAFWSVALLALWRMRDSPTLLRGLLFGAALGAAMLAKYAAAYILAGALLAAIVDRPTRKALLSPAGLMSVLGLALVFAPNLIWNAAHKFATLSHTADNADWEDASADPVRAFEFLRDQLGVFGPVTMVVLLVGGALALARVGKAFVPAADGETAGISPLARDLWAISFVLPPLAVILVQAVISRAHANWAATAYPAACLLLGAWIADRRWRWPVIGGVALNTVIGLIFCVAAVAPSLADKAGASNAVKRVRGWQEMTNKLRTIAAEQKATALFFDERENWHGVDYYGRNLPDLPPLRAWIHAAEPHSFAEEVGRLRPGEDARVLIISQRDDFRPMIRGDFTRMDRLPELVIPLDGNPKHDRVMAVYLASGYHPAPRDEAWRARFKNNPTE